MSAAPLICFGQQPCGFYPRRFLYAKIQTARRLQSEIGGEIVYFCHDSDHDPRETQTLLRHAKTGELARLNFTFANKVQRKWSPLYLKRVDPVWKRGMERQLPAYVGDAALAAFGQTSAANAADFCLEIYRRLGLLEGIRLARSSDPAFRRAACDIADYYVDIPYKGETVRARRAEAGLRLHQGGDSYVTVPPIAFSKEQVSPTRDTRLRWMQSVLHCTHYIAGAGEQAYLRCEEAPEATFVPREPIERADEAYTGEP